MGLDMYLYSMPRCEMDPNKVSELAYLHSRLLRGEWGVRSEIDQLPEDELAFAKKYFPTATKTYCSWDAEKSFPYSSISEEVAYWRKANAIHRWFVDNVQDGEDDCRFHREVTAEDLEDLYGRCENILREAVIAKGKIANGYTYQDGTKITNFVDGEYVVDPSICEEELPCQEGFFFGNQDYNEYYMEDIKHTYETLKKLLNEFDFENRRLYYVSSW